MNRLWTGRCAPLNRQEEGYVPGSIFMSMPNLEVDEAQTIIVCSSKSLHRERTAADNFDKNLKENPIY